MLISLLIFLCCGAIVGVLPGCSAWAAARSSCPCSWPFFHTTEVPAQLRQQLALGTSPGQHHVHFRCQRPRPSQTRRGERDIFMRITPGILVGTFCGRPDRHPSAHNVPQDFLFICFLIAISCQMFANYRPRPAATCPARLARPRLAALSAWFPAFVGIGGGSLSVPFMSFCGIDIHKAVGTSAAIGFPIAVAGALGYIVGGWGGQICRQ